MTTALGVAENPMVTAKLMVWDVHDTVADALLGRSVPPYIPKPKRAL
jgi:hypothetical protein